MNNIKLMIFKNWPFLDFHSYFTEFGRQNVEASINLISAFAKKKNKEPPEAYFNYFIEISVIVFWKANI
jgi:hypothetical protein